MEIAVHCTNVLYDVSIFHESFLTVGNNFLDGTVDCLVDQRTKEAYIDIADADGARVSDARSLSVLGIR